jgi:hypothetical protein
MSVAAASSNNVISMANGKHKSHFHLRLEAAMQKPKELMERSKGLI